MPISGLRGANRRSICARWTSATTRVFAHVLAHRCHFGIATERSIDGHLIVLAATTPKGNPLSLPQATHPSGLVDRGCTRSAQNRRPRFLPRGIVTKMTVRVQGEPMENTLAWAETELEGFMRSEHSMRSTETHSYGLIFCAATHVPPTNGASMRARP